LASPPPLHAVKIHTENINPDPEKNTLPAGTG
jgi:hypothetical protein